MIWQHELTQLVSEAIRDSGLPQRLIAQRAGCHESTISLIVHGKYRVSPELATDVLRVCDQELVISTRPIESHQLWVRQ